ncbi:MAG: hypothetical protein KBT57_08890 [bacterium]|nr:hypothetical protein [Candidatus Limimorpha equi]
MYQDIELTENVCYNTRKSRLSTYQRAGFFLSQYNDGLGLSDDFFKHCKERIGCNVCYLSADEDSDAFDNEWKICVPKSLRKQKEYGQY